MVLEPLEERGPDLLLGAAAGDDGDVAAFELEELLVSAADGVDEGNETTAAPPPAILRTIS